MWSRSRYDDHMEGTRSQKTDWGKIKADYVTGTGSLRELAKKYEVGVSAISMRAKREKWTKDKEACEKIVRDKVIEQTAHIMISNNERAMKVIDTLLVKAEQGAILLEPKDTRGMKDITSVLSELKDLGAFQTEVTDVKIEIGGEAETYAD